MDKKLVPGMVLTDPNGYRLRILSFDVYEAISYKGNPSGWFVGKTFKIGRGEELAYREGDWKLDENYIIDKLLEKYL